MEKKSLGLKLLELRQAHNLTQKELCSALNIGRSTYSYFESGRRIPDVETLLLIAGYYKVSLDELVSDRLAAGTGMQAEPAREGGTQKTDSPYSDIQILHHLKSRHIPVDFVLGLSKADFDFLRDYKELTDDNQAELQYLMNYKLRKQIR